jgi:hypothetical protein
MSVPSDTIKTTTYRKGNLHMARNQGKAINVKIPVAKLISALEDKLVTLNKDIEDHDKAKKAYDGQVELFNASIVKAMGTKGVKLGEVSICSRSWSDTVTVGFTVPKSFLSMEEPESPESNFYRSNHNEQISEIGNALRLLRMTEEVVVSTSTYNSVSRYL